MKKKPIKLNSEEARSLFKLLMDHLPKDGEKQRWKTIKIKEEDYHALKRIKKRLSEEYPEFSVGLGDTVSYVVSNDTSVSSDEKKRKRVISEKSIKKFFGEEEKC